MDETQTPLVHNSKSASMPQESIQNFVHDAETSDVTNPRPFPAPSTPNWVKPELIKAGQEFIQKHFFAIYFAHFISLLLLFCYEPVRIILLRTEKSVPSSKSLLRYFSTLSHLRLWYEGNLLDEHSAASRDIQSIRKVHANVAQTITTIARQRQDRILKVDRQRFYDKNSAAATGKNTGNPSEANADKKSVDVNIVDAVQRDFMENQFNVPSSQYQSYAYDPESTYPAISQLDMIITQFCFMGFLSQYPKVFGIDLQRGGQNGLAGFLHLWALIGHRLGIEDRFNLCIDSNELLAKQKILIAQDTFLRALSDVCDGPTKTSAAHILTMWESLIDGIAYFIPFMSLPAMLSFFMVHILEFKRTPNTDQFFTWYDRLCLQLMNICFQSWLPSTIGRSVLNLLLKLAFILTSIRLYYLAPAIRVLKKLISMISI